MSRRHISMYPEKCALCGAPRIDTEEGEVFHHTFTCQWRTDKSWTRSVSEVEELRARIAELEAAKMTGTVNFDVRWQNGSSSITAKITEDQYFKVLKILHPEVEHAPEKS